MATENERRRLVNPNLLDPKLANLANRTNADINAYNNSLAGYNQANFNVNTGGILNIPQPANYGYPSGTPNATAAATLPQINYLPAEKRPQVGQFGYATQEENDKAFPELAEARKIQENAGASVNNNTEQQSPIQTVPQLLANTGLNGGKNQYTLPDYQAKTLSDIPVNNALTAPLANLSSNRADILSNQQALLNDPNARINMDNYNQTAQGFLDRADQGLLTTGQNQITRYDELLNIANKEYQDAEEVYKSGGDLLATIAAKRRMAKASNDLTNLENARSTLNRQLNSNDSTLYNTTAKDLQSANFDANKLNTGFVQNVGMEAMRNLNKDAESRQAFEASQLLAQQRQALSEGSPESQLRNLTLLNAQQQDERSQLLTQEAMRNPNNIRALTLASLGGNAQATNMLSNINAQENARIKALQDENKTFRSDIKSLLSKPISYKTPSSKGVTSDNKTYDLETLNSEVEGYESQINKYREEAQNNINNPKLYEEALKKQAAEEKKRQKALSTIKTITTDSLTSQGYSLANLQANAQQLEMAISDPRLTLNEKAQATANLETIKALILKYK